ncbi:MAG TPA: VWA domain-containing protein [Bacteroidales bacterium]|nr:VWA domain-containing protein [Bacteroidales bacterium]
MSFKNPEYLYFLLLLLPMIFWYVWELRKSDASMQISSTKIFKDSPKTARMKLRHLPFILRLLAIVFLVFAIAHPQSSSNWRTESKEGIDIMMALDISGTMQIEDLRPTRLDAAKTVAVEFIQSRPNDNIGLVVFAGESFTQCPLTTDHAVLINLFSGLNYGIISDGTAIGLGLANAVNRIKDGKAKSKVIILLTDGSNNQGDIAPITAAEIAKTYGVRVYAIGVGSHGTVKMPIQTPFGVRYQEIKSEFDEKTLQDIADMTGGQYFRATNTAKLRSIYQEIDQLEKTKISVQEYSNKRELYFVFALLALVFFLIEVFLRNSWLRTLP